LASHLSYPSIDEALAAICGRVTGSDAAPRIVPALHHVY
jgi:hypothetical protein